MLNHSYSETPRSVLAGLWLFAFADKWRRTIVLALAVGLALILADQAFAGCDAIPERRKALCEQLGYQADPCQFEFDGRRVKGELVISIDEHEDGPLLRASSIRLITDDAEVVQLYARLERGTLDEVEVSQFLNEHEDHGEVTETDLLDVENVVNHVFYQAADAAQAAELQAAYDSGGWPIVTDVRGASVELTDQTQTALASVFRVPVVIRFAMPQR